MKRKTLSPAWRITGGVISALALVSCSSDTSEESTAASAPPEEPTVPTAGRPTSVTVAENTEASPRAVRHTQ